MYAIVETGGKQYRVKAGDTIAVERVAGEPGEVLNLGRVLLIAGNGESARVGAPGVEGAVVRAEVLEQGRGEKIVVFRYKSKVRYRRKTGHRQALTRLRITDILLDGASTTTAAAEPVTDTPVEPVPPIEEPAAVAELAAVEEPAAVAEPEAIAELQAVGEPEAVAEPEAVSEAETEPETEAVEAEAVEPEPPAQAVDSDDSEKEAMTTNGS